MFEFGLSNLLLTLFILYEENGKFWPNKYDKILTVIYGDYMKLPPIEERVDHNPRKIIFEDKEEFLFDK